MILIALAVLAAINVLALALMGIDKALAKAGAWRISERALFLPVVLGGAAGGVLGMTLFRHKTNHWQFRLGFPVLFGVQLVLLILAVLWLAGLLPAGGS